MNAETAKTGVPPADTFEHLIVLAETGGDEDLKEAVASLHPADVAELINRLERSEIRNKLFRVLAPDIAPTVLTLVSALAREEIVQELSDNHLRQILEELDSDDAADLVGSIPKERAQSILAGLPGPLSARIQQLLRYPADTAGGLMQSEYAAVLEGALPASASRRPERSRGVDSRGRHHGQRAPDSGAASPRQRLPGGMTG